MPIKWSALAVSEAMDRVEEQLCQAKPFLEEAKRLVEEARRLPHIPQYLDMHLAGLLGEIGRIAWAPSQRVSSVRADIPSNAIARERDQQRQNGLFD